MNISVNDAERLAEIADEINELVDEFKQICRRTFERQEYDQFKYRTLGHLEPAVNDNHEWMTKYSSIDSLAKVAEKAVDEAVGVAEEAEED